MKPGLHVIEVRDKSGNLYRKAVAPGCLDVVIKALQMWLGRALWFLFGLLIGYVWNG